MLSLLKDPTIQGVGAGQTANVRFPINPTYHEFYLEFAGLNTGLADVKEIRVFSNGKVIHRFSGVERDRMNRFDKRTPFGAGTSGILIVPLTRYNMKTANAEMVTAVSTGAGENADARNVVGEFRMEIDFADGDYNPSVKSSTQRSLGRATGAGSIIHTRTFTETISAAGQHDISTLTRGTVSTAAINRIFLIPNANEIEKVEISVDQFTTFERSKALNDRLQLEGVRQPETIDQSMFVIDFGEQGYGGELLQTVGVQDLRFMIDVTGPMQLKLIVEYVGGLDG